MLLETLLQLGKVTSGIKIVVVSGLGAIGQSYWSISVESQEPIRIRNKHGSCLQVLENSANRSPLFSFLNRILIGVEISLGTLSQSQSVAARN